MTVISMNYLLEAGVHFGHQKRRWNPKMKEYIFTTRDDIYIIDLQKTLRKIEEAYVAMKEIVEKEGSVLFVGTKKQAQEAAEECAARTDMYFITERWLGGTLTNFRTIRSRVKRLDEIEQMEKDGIFDLLPKKEVIKIRKEYDKLHRNLRGIREMRKLPQALVIVDPRKEEIAIKEARILNIPIFGIVDTNCDPDMVDYVIPGNDDAVRSVKVMLGALTNAIAEVNGKEVIDYVSEDDKNRARNREEKKARNREENREPRETVGKVEVKAEKVEEPKEVKVEVKEVKAEEPKVEAKEPKVEAKEEVDFTKMTLVALKEMAKEKGIKGYSKLKKDEIIELLK